MLRSLYTGVAGLRNQQTKLEVVGNNVANANTTAFKRSRVNIQDSFSQTLRSAVGPTDISQGRNPLQVGLGSSVGSIDRIHEQGSLELTGQTTDLALMGRGYFMVEDGGRNLYTRNGAFQFNALGTLVDAAGRAVQGQTASATGTFGSLSEYGSITLPLGMKQEAQATRVVRFRSNLDADASESTATLAAGNTANAGAVSGTTLDGVGGTLTVTVDNTLARGQQTTARVAADLDLPLSTWLSDPALLDGINSTRTEEGEITDRSVSLAGLDLDSTLQQLLDRLENQVDGFGYNTDSGSLQLQGDIWGQGNSLLVSGTALETIMGGPVSLLGAGSVTASGSFLAQDGRTETFNLGPITSVTSTSTGALSQLELPNGLLVESAGGGFTSGSFTLEVQPTSHSTSITVYDSLGTAWPLDVTFTRSSQENTWTWAADVAGATITGGGSGTVTFDEAGNLASFSHDGGAEALTFTPAGGGADVSLVLDAGTLGSNDGITQTARDFTTQAYAQDGYPMGVLEQLAIQEDGTVLGAFSNGTTQTMARLVLADFANEQGLAAVGDSAYAVTGASGQARLVQAGETTGTSIQSGYLEMSNADLTQEFTEMIVAQRGYQAAAKIITTADTLLDEVIRIKR